MRSNNTHHLKIGSCFLEQPINVIIDNESSNIPINFLIICASFYNFNYTKIILQEYVSVCYNGKNEEMSIITSNNYSEYNFLLNIIKKKTNHGTTLERYLVTLFEDYNFKQSQRIHKGFGQCSDTLESLFD